MEKVKLVALINLSAVRTTLDIFKQLAINVRDLTESQMKRKCNRTALAD